MEVLQLRERGQITIPKAMREALGLREPGARLLAYVEDGRLILEPVNHPSGDLLDLLGLLPSRGAVDVNQARRDAQRERGRRWEEGRLVPQVRKLEARKEVAATQDGGD